MKRVPGYLHHQIIEAAEFVLSALDQGPLARQKASRVERIAVIDDEEAMTEMTATFLERWGYLSVEYPSADRFLRSFSAAPERFSLVIADVVMPEMTGLQLVRVLREAGHRVPMLLMTGFDVQDRLEMGDSSGRISFLRKPFTSVHLEQSVRRLLTARRSFWKAPLR
jgi:FixJ family two-component response regulator